MFYFPKGVIEMAATANEIMFDKPLRYEDDGDILFMMPDPPKPKRVAATGKSIAGQPFQVVTPAIVEVSEEDVLNNALDCLRLGLMEPTITMSVERAAQINREAIGMACQWDGTRAIE
jgi:hypothetical protein